LWLQWGNCAGVHENPKEGLTQMREKMRELTARELDQVGGGIGIDPIPTTMPKPQPIPPA
jgi:hypothetical protein